VGEIIRYPDTRSWPDSAGLGGLFFALGFPFCVRCFVSLLLQRSRVLAGAHLLLSIVSFRRFMFGRPSASVDIADPCRSSRLAGLVIAQGRPAPANSVVCRSYPAVTELPEAVGTAFRMLKSATWHVGRTISVLRRVGCVALVKRVAVRSDLMVFGL